MLTLPALTYIEGSDVTGGRIRKLCHRNPEILERVLNGIALSNATTGNCASMQVIKQPERGRTSTTEEQN